MTSSGPKHDSQQTQLPLVQLATAQDSSSSLGEEAVKREEGADLGVETGRDEDPAHGESKDDEEGKEGDEEGNEDYGAWAEEYEDEEGDKDAADSEQDSSLGYPVRRSTGEQELLQPSKGEGRLRLQQPHAGGGPRQSKILGIVLGAAIGDAMGHPTEFISSLDSIYRKYGPQGVTELTLFWEKDGKRFAPYTDDTQMAEVVLRCLLSSQEHEEDLDAAMRRLARGFIQWADHPQGGHRAPGNACLAGCQALKSGTHWSKAGGAQAGGCGSVMRAYPFGLIFSEDLSRAERWAVAHSKLTHGDPIALAASAAMAVGVARVMRGESLARILSEMVAAACRYSPRTAAMIAEAIDEAEQGMEPEVTLKRLQGWAAHEAIAAATYIFCRHPDDPRAAILEGANTPGDSDSLATLAGALVGGRCGIEGLPPAWVEQVERSAELIQLGQRV